MPKIVSVAGLTQQVAAIFTRHGVSPDNAAAVTETVVAAERDGALSHGLLRLPGYVASLKSGWVDGKAMAQVIDAAAGLVATDAANGFAQPALNTSAALLRDKARRQGIAALAIRNSHHFAALWPDIEPFAADGFIALAAVSGRARIVVWDGKKKVLGTNPLAFACPRAGRPPLVWDQASSVMAQGEVLLAAQHGEALPPGVGLDPAGEPTLDPSAVLAGGALLPFAGYKGASVAFMVEILGSALTGAPFGYEDASAAYPGAQTSKGGQTVILIDPAAVPGSRYVERIEDLFAALAESGVERLPAERRYANRERAMREGIAVSDRDWAMLQELTA